MVSPQMNSPPVTSSTTAPSPPKTSAAYKPNRFGRPCDACKRRKQRCVFREGQDEICVMCEFQNVPCTFIDIGMATPVTRKRNASSGDATIRKRRQKTK
jgi:hypothetical protein